MLTVDAADKFPSSEAFELINTALNSSEEDRKDAIKQGNGIYAFTLKNKAGETESWHIDLKETGKVATGTGAKPSGTSTHCTIPWLDDLCTNPIAQSRFRCPTPTLRASSLARPTPSACSCPASSRSRAMS